MATIIPPPTVSRGTNGAYVKAVSIPGSGQGAELDRGDDVLTIVLTVRRSEERLNPTAKAIQVG